MKKVLTLLLLIYLMMVPLGSNVFAQGTCTTQEQSYDWGCVGGDCFCYSMTMTCSGTTCVVSGGYCDYGEVSISWSTQTCSSPV